MKRPSHTTSTKCQYQATASNAKCLVGVKCPRSTRSQITSSMIAPIVTCRPWKPVSMKKVGAVEPGRKPQSQLPVGLAILVRLEADEGKPQEKRQRQEQ